MAKQHKFTVFLSVVEKSLSQCGYHLPNPLGSQWPQQDAACGHYNT